MATQSFASFLSGPLRITTRWHRNSRSWITSMWKAKSAPTDTSGRWARMRRISSRKCGRCITGTITPKNIPTLPRAIYRSRILRAATRVKALQGHLDEGYRGFDLNYYDLKRAERFIAELKRFENEGEMPRLQIVRLPNDHTHGSSRGFRTPTAYVADNDLALGQIVEAVSHSKFWPRTAMFVVEDDAQNGPDHVDAHRTIAFVISPYTRRGAVDSNMYSTSSMLRTME